MIDRELLDILACPSCLGTVRQEAEEIVCNGCGRRYPVRRKVPVMLLEEASPRDDTGPKPV